MSAAPPSPSPAAADPGQPSAVLTRRASLGFWLTVGGVVLLLALLGYAMIRASDREATSFAVQSALRNIPVTARPAPDFTLPLFDGTTLRGPAGVRAYVERSEALFAGNFARNLLMFALGRILQPSDMPAVRRIARQAAGDGNRFSAFVLGVAGSTPFTMRQADAGPGASPVPSRRTAE